MSLKTKDWVGLGLGAAAIGGGFRDGKFSFGNYSKNWGGLPDSLGFGGSTEVSGANTVDLTRLAPHSFGDVAPMSMKNTPVSTSSTSSWWDGLAGLAGGTSDFLGSNAGKNTLSFAAPVVSGLIKGRAAERAAGLQAQSAADQTAMYRESLAADQARIAADQKKRDEQSLAMSQGFGRAGLM